MVLSVSEANSETIKIYDIPNIDSALDYYEEAYEFEGSIEGVTKDIFLDLGTSVDMYYYEQPVTLLKDKKFLPPGDYVLRFHTNAYTFTIKPSGQIYSKLPLLKQLPQDLLTVIASYDGASIGEIWDMCIQSRNFCTPSFS